MQQRLSIRLQGALQGVGFRPFVHRLAAEERLTGWVLNSPEGVLIDVEGDPAALESFHHRLQNELPPHAFIQSLERTLLDPAGYAEFLIRPSRQGEAAGAIVLPDIAPCPDCLRELLDPEDRRYRYPFINCTRCGPRFTIIRTLPYDRPNTSMADFPLCAECAAEYGNPADRRFHAQPVACPACGPHLTYVTTGGVPEADRDEALGRAVALVREGGILALKGVGGFHLIVRADDADAVGRLRTRKQREEKPFALMVAGVEQAAEICRMSHAERRALCAPEAPIVLFESDPSARTRIAANVAPENPLRGVLLPSSPLHVLFLRDLGLPVVATSGNLSEEPICTGNDEALTRLGPLADGFLMHNRPILRHADDSILRIVDGEPMVLRRARGIAPLPVTLPRPTERTVLAVGAHLKNTVALARGSNCFLSQHIGDLSTADAHDAFHAAASDMQGMFGTASAVACDMHPDYLSSVHAQSLGVPVVSVQHHAAHVAACMAENELDGPCLGVSWDGTGYGADGTIWGGEFFLHEEGVFRRVATILRFRLPGGEHAAREPRRSALGMLAAAGMADRPQSLPAGACTPGEREQFLRMVESGLNSPWTTSAGRLFDGAASLLGLRHRSAFEGQAAMRLEFAAAASRSQKCYAMSLSAGDGPVVINWTPAVLGMLEDRNAGAAVEDCAYAFHAGLAAAIADVAGRVGQERVLLTGGCFQNRLLTELTSAALRSRGFRVYRHQRVPPNDGGISLGQAYAAVLAAARTDHQ